MCLGWREKPRARFSQPHKQRDDGLRKVVEDQVDAENMSRKAGRRIDKHAGEQPDGPVETYWWSQPVLTNDCVSQMENREGKDEEKHYCGGQFLPGSCHLYFHFSSFYLLNYRDLSFSCSLSSYLSGMEARADSSIATEA